MIIAIEGGDACAKATQTKRLVERFRSNNVEAEAFDFPRYQTITGQVIRGLLTGEWSVRMHDQPKDFAVTPRHAHAVREEEARLRALVLQCCMLANRHEAIEKLQKYDDDRAPVLVLDRYWLSGMIYGASDGLDEKCHRALPQPDLWVLLDVPVDEGFKRRPERRDLYERDRDKLEDVRRRYKERFHAEGSSEEWRVIDGVGTIEEVHERVWEACLGLRARLA